MEKLTPQDVLEVLDLFTRVPSLMLKALVIRQVNVVETFHEEVETYKKNLRPEDLAKIETVISTPTPQLQEILAGLPGTTSKTVEDSHGPRCSPLLGPEFGSP